MSTYPGKNMSANIVELLNNSIESTTQGDKYYIKFLESCVEHGTFNFKENAELIIKNINTSLNSQFEKEKGLILMLSYLPHISVDTFSSNAVSWMLYCNKIIGQKGGGINTLAYGVLSSLLKLSVKFPDVSKEASKQIVPKLMSDNLKRSTRIIVSIEFLQCLRACMSGYSGPCGDFKTDVLRMLLNSVEAKEDVVSEAARCMSQLPRVGGGGKQGASHKAAWRQQQMELLVLCHFLLNSIYQHIQDIPDVEVTELEDLRITLEPVHEKNILIKTQRLANQFTSITRFLQAMLLEEFPVPKMVAMDIVLDVIAHAQKPTHTSLGTSTEDLAVMSVLPSIQAVAMALLQALILCVGRNLVPRGGVVCHLCSQLLVWSHKQNSNWSYGMDKPYRHLRVAVYRCLQAWLQVGGAASQLETVADQLIPRLLADIQAQRPEVKLIVGSKKRSGKKKQHMLESVEERSEKLRDEAANSELCEAALEALSLLVSACCHLLQPHHFTNIVKTVLLLSEELPVPYREPRCRAALYQLLLTLCLRPHPHCSPPLAPALAVFTTGLHNPEHQVKEKCVWALNSLEKIIHPTAATLYFPLPMDIQRSSTRELRKEVEEEEELFQASPIKRRRTEKHDDNSESTELDLIDCDSPENNDKGEDSNDSIVVLSVKDFDLQTKENKLFDNPSNSEISNYSIHDSSKEILDNDIAVDDEYIFVDEAQEKVNSDKTESPKESENVSVINEDNGSSLRSQTEETIEKSVDISVENFISNEENIGDPDVAMMLLDFKDEPGNTVEGKPDA